jgi:hypothetical protein
MAYFPNSLRKIRLGRPATYPWDEWTDGRERLLREGQEFTCMAESFVLLARRTARVRGLHVVASTTTVPANAGPLMIRVDSMPTWLQPGGTYVLLKFTPQEEE